LRLLWAARRTVNGQAPLVETLSDSLIELTLALEEAFDVEISGRDSDRVVTVQDVVDLIEARTRKESADARATAP
jgi:acyl carrier protein